MIFDDEVEPSKAEADCSGQDPSLTFEVYNEEQGEDTCLFVGDLGSNVTEEMLRKEFSRYGGVEKIDMKRDRETGNSLGYCFVHFRTKSEANQAMKMAHRTKLGSRSIRIGRAKKNTCLYIADLHPTITSECLKDAFRRFGALSEVGPCCQRRGEITALDR